MACLELTNMHRNRQSETYSLKKRHLTISVTEYFGTQDVTTVLLFHEQSSTKHKKNPAHIKYVNKIPNFKREKQLHKVYLTSSNYNICIKACKIKE